MKLENIEEPIDFVKRLFMVEKKKITELTLNYEFWEYLFIWNFHFECGVQNIEWTSSVNHVIIYSMQINGILKNK